MAASHVLHHVATTTSQSVAAASVGRSSGCGSRDIADTGSTTTTPTSQPRSCRSLACRSATWIPPDGSSVGTTNATRIPADLTAAPGLPGRPLSWGRMPEHGHAARSNASNDDRDARLGDLRHESERLRAAAATVPALERELATLRADLATIDASWSWRLTAPVRATRAAIVNRRQIALAAGRIVKRRLEG